MLSFHSLTLKVQHLEDSLIAKNAGDSIKELQSIKDILSKKAMILNKEHVISIFFLFNCLF